jgi:hypothetical protein
LPRILAVAFPGSNSICVADGEARLEGNKIGSAYEKSARIFAPREVYITVLLLLAGSSIAAAQNDKRPLRLDWILELKDLPLPAFHRLRGSIFGKPTCNRHSTRRRRYG